jgi:hypothetical protein
MKASEAIIINNYFPPLTLILTAWGIIKAFFEKIKISPR